MTCPKCKGLMVREYFADVFFVRFEHRCLCCGKISFLPLRHIRATDARPINPVRWGREEKNRKRIIVKRAATRMDA